MVQPTLRERMRYRLDSFLARGNGALFTSLAAGFLGSLLGITLLRVLLGVVSAPTKARIIDHTWTAFLEMTDPGNMNQDNETPPAFKLGAVVAGFTGVVIFSSLIAFMTTALSDALGHLRKGHSRVIEKGHTLIVGWGPRVVEILRELAIANESQSDAVVVVLAEHDKEAMDESLRLSFRERRTTRLITRSGPTATLVSLRQVSAGQARTAVVLATCDPAASEDDKAASDAHSIKVVLALFACTPADSPLSVVAEVFEPRNRDVVEGIAPGRVVVVDAEDILAKLMVQTSRTSGLAIVYQELLSFEGCEIYYHRAPTWNGVTFGRAQYRFPRGIPIGICKRDGTVLKTPPIDTIVEDGDELIVVAEDDSAVAFAAEAIVVPEHLPILDRRAKQKRERMLLVGWSTKAAVVIREYAGYVLPGSRLDVVLGSAPPRVIAQIDALREANTALELGVISANPLVITELQRLDPFSYDTIIVLRQDVESVHDPERVDAESIVVLLHLRRLHEQRGAGGAPASATTIITEVMESSNQELIARAGVDDYIISNKLVSMILAQLSQEPRMRRVYEDLFQVSGSEIYVKSAALYLADLPRSVRFCDLMQLAQERGGEVCIGYKVKALEKDATRNFGVVLDPPKDRVLRLEPGDGLIVVAEDDR